MKYNVTPLCLTREITSADPMATFATDEKHTVQAITSYEERQTIEADVSDAHDACEQAWKVFQNIDENWKTPDGGRSLMVGDMVRLESEEGREWWICCSMGWAQTVEPGSQAQRIEK